MLLFHILDHCKSLSYYYTNLGYSTKIKEESQKIDNLPILAMLPAKSMVLLLLKILVNA